jgi:hypothetical protein
MDKRNIAILIMTTISVILILVLLDSFSILSLSGLVSANGSPSIISQGELWEDTGVSVRLKQWVSSDVNIGDGVITANKLVGDGSDIFNLDFSQVTSTINYWTARQVFKNSARFNDGSVLAFGTGPNINDDREDRFNGDVHAYYNPAGEDFYITRAVGGIVDEFRITGMKNTRIEHGNFTVERGEIRGSKHLQLFTHEGFRTNSLTQYHYLNLNNIQTNANSGLMAIGPGSVTGISINYDVDSVQENGAIFLEVTKNGNPFWTQELDSRLGENRQLLITQPRNTDSFNAADSITLRIKGSEQGFVEVSDVIATLEFYLN